jgi:hypothetical protein
MTAILDRALVAADAGQVTDGKPADPDPEVPERARRRSFTAQYELEVLAAYEAAEPGEEGTMLRREGLTPVLCHVSHWCLLRFGSNTVEITVLPGHRG